ncbi:phospholipid carrier-dependent glycosyltransferase [Halosimplex litoreum]|uniref:Phospholipid carrier-dependent glycosyltransferase n=1 Tax=Halosimplex litoreum TaxID=1198301 RepID=A0A7T3KW34_9EURY|nr:phospholipid carrier-dependent glycosyltransferase [Halosimplex litoreum]QPV63628.1 phospholipid carrier-dependent glycosyltransferase [Halosimplex litoreum]
MSERSAAASLIEDRPDLTEDLRTLLEVDAAAETWTFDDTEVDSGTFGELVERDVVEKEGDGYRLADPDAVRQALGDDGVTDDRPRVGRPTFSTVDLDSRRVGALVAALSAVVLARVISYPSVFRDGTVVLSGNDPYAYRYWVERTLLNVSGPLDIGPVLTGVGPTETGEPLFVAVTTLVASLFGGTPAAAGWTLAWYPVVTAVATAAVLYALVVALTDDRRVALAAVVLLAVTPGHAMRTSLGFADHHAFDYVPLAVTAYGLVAVDGTDGLRDRRAWLGAGVVAAGLAGQILGWSAGPLLVVPVVGYVAVRAVQDVRAGDSPARRGLPVVAGVGAAAVVVAGAHAALGWHDSVVAVTPALLLAAVVGVLAVAELVGRADAPPWAVVPASGVAGIAGLAAVAVAAPAVWTRATGRFGDLFASRGIAETRSLLDGGSVGWLLLFGFVLVLAAPWLAWATRRATRSDAAWAVPVAYGWWFLLLAAVQVRFAGQLAVFAAAFAGLGFVHLASVVDLGAPPAPLDPDRTGPRSLSIPTGRRAAQVLALFVLVAGLGVVQVPVKTSQVTTDGDAYRAAAWTADDAAERGLASPDSYVFSRWGDNRMYNYVVSGQSRSYGFARANFGPFASAANASGWYPRLRDRVGYVVVEGSGFESGTVGARLAGSFGGRTADAPGLAHYRVRYRGPDGRVVASVVPGARLVGTAAPNRTQTLATNVTVDGRTVRYERRVRANATGAFAVTVPYPGRYTLGNTTVAVDERAVRNGGTVGADIGARASESAVEPV